MKKLLVGSVFANDNPLQKKWLDIQLKCLSETTDSYDHVVVLSEPAKDGYFSSKTKVIVPPDTTLRESTAHIQGLNCLLDYFKSSINEYDNFLFLDGDAFPIKKQWLPALLQKMQLEYQYDNGIAIGNPIGRNYEVAVVLRCENLETRWHASVLFVKKEALEHLSFSIGIAGNDLAGNTEEDVIIPEFQFKRKESVFPLIRTNQYNFHPVACGVYYDMFYHHCCGSGREFVLRSERYYNKIVKTVDKLTPLTNNLFADPCGFVKKIAGWNESRYINFKET